MKSVPGSHNGWWETDLDCSSDTITPQRGQTTTSAMQQLQFPANYTTANTTTSATNPPLLRQNLEPKSRASTTDVNATPVTSRAGVMAAGSKAGQAANGPVKPLLPFNVTPPKPSG